MAILTNFINNECSVLYNMEVSQIGNEILGFVKDSTYLYKRIMRLQKAQNLTIEEYAKLLTAVDELNRKMKALRFEIDEQLIATPDNKKLLKLNKGFMLMEEKFKVFLDDLSKFEDFKTIIDKGFYNYENTKRGVNNGSTD